MFELIKMDRMSIRVENDAIFYGGRGTLIEYDTFLPLCTELSNYHHMVWHMRTQSGGMTAVIDFNDLKSRSYLSVELVFETFDFLFNRFWSWSRWPHSAVGVAARAGSVRKEPRSISWQTSE